MKKIICLLVLSLLLFPNVAFSADDPFHKECVQRGYEVTYTKDWKVSYCTFPDGNKCVLKDFNDGLCGSRYKSEDYCVAEGGFVWDKDKCCPGTEAYSIPGRIGPQPKCLRISVFEKFYNQMRYNPFAWIYSVGGILIFFIIFSVIAMIRKRKKSNHDDQINT